MLNHDSAVAAAGARMVAAAGGRPCLEMGSRRTHEEAAVAAARAGYLVGFSATSNLEAGRRYGVPTAGTSAHAFTMVHRSEAEAFAAQVRALGVGTTLLVDTYDVTEAITRAVAAAGPELGAIRIDSGDLAATARAARAQLDRLGARSTRIVATGDLDEYRIARLASAPVDGYGVGTRFVAGSGAPTAGFVYKLVEVDGTPVAKSSVGKATRGGRKTIVRRRGDDGIAIADLVFEETAAGSARSGQPGARPAATDPERDRTLITDLVRAGRRVGCEQSPAAALAQAREHHRATLAELPASAHEIVYGQPCLPVVRLAHT